MTKVTVKVTSDTISKTGRHISISLLDTDDSVVNDYLSLPININKTYANNISLQNIRKEMKFILITEGNSEIEMDVDKSLEVEVEINDILYVISIEKK